MLPLLKTQKCLVCFPEARKVKGLSTEAQVTALSTHVRVLSAVKMQNRLRFTVLEWNELI